MKIIHIGKFYPPYHFGGIETLSKILHEELQIRGLDNDFLGYLPSKYKNDIVLDNGIYLCKTNIDIFSTQFSINFIKKWLEIKDQYEIIFISMPNPYSNLIVNIFSSTKAKIVLWWHSDIVKQKMLLFFYKPFMLSLIKKSIAVVAPTNTHIDQSDFAKYLIPRKKIIPFPHYMKVKQYPFTLKNNKYIIFSCGRLIYYKGFHVLIDSAEYLPDNCIIHIAGKGKLYDKLAKKIIKRNLQEKVFLLGHISDEQMEQELQNCFLFCLPSVQRSEMYALVQVDAFCHGKPVISTNIPRSGVSEVNQDSVTGYIVNTENPKAIADKVKLLLHNTDLYEKICRNALKRGEELTDKDIINKYVELFGNIASSDIERVKKRRVIRL
jgi:rhamnosyl/mannosyltransferase